MEGRRADTETFGVLAVFGDIPFGYFRNGAALRLCPVYHFIVHIGEILDKYHLVAELFKIASEHIENDKTAGVSYMYVIIHSGPADIHANFFIFYIKFFLASGKRIIKLH